MERGCRPILKVQFFPGFETKDSMLFTVTPPPTFGKFYLIFCGGTLILLIWQTFIFILSYEAGFYKPTSLKVHFPMLVGTFQLPLLRHALIQMNGV
jgi:hypothetical protein